MKKKRTPRLWDIVQIDWLDSLHLSGWQKWQDVDWQHERSTLTHKTTGYLAQDTEQSVAVVQSFQDLWRDGHPAYVDAVMTIPKAAITHMRVLVRKK